MSEECLFSVNERTTLVLTANFIDEDSLPVTPSAATYRIDDEASKISILPVTSFPSLSTSVDIEITSAENRILKERHASETRTVTVEFDYGSGKHGTSAYKYRVMNLYGVATVPSASISPSASASPSV